jgi:hypothetical protein
MQMPKLLFARSLGAAATALTRLDAIGSRVLPRGQPDLGRRSASLVSVPLLFRSPHGWQSQSTDEDRTRKTSVLWLCHPCG